MTLPDPARADGPQGPLRVAVLGCSGSIGRQTLDVCRRHPDRLRVTALSVDTSTSALVAAAREFGASHVAVANAGHGGDPVLRELPERCELTLGADAVTALASLPDVDVVVNALVGFAGMHAGYAALAADKLLAYANKESIVCGGDLLMPLVRPGRLIPVDSEHSAIFQCLVGERDADLRRIWLTCSGGPFYGRSREELASVTAADALAHPTWTMGAKITIDCATLMNKGLEVIEAHHLFGVPIDAISVLIHRQSKIHSMVEFADGVVKAQLGASDMRAPIQYALSYPERWEAVAETVDWRLEGPLTFDAPDVKTFGCLRLACDAGRTGGTLPCAMNAANEVANAAFRTGACGFLDIERVVSRVMDETDVEPVESLAQLDEVDARARARAAAMLAEVRG
ncbi:1-deoxy-D-xylulose-5-phosphate reductoisomerase [Olsenella uli]|uniref:1-deoxy-D-xylulose-5-phosphate reductoisomerase n=1 Tax=Olsenella uli TaxID=133926 RepID=UPI00195C2388|nr:1-deoxy-D-xylulose-5-phosphate reductoisomerase [Olsenella uli]MBM6675141.1 1-deoxy-D-xylulose-5-phosphate reductoisomerase [Olsenella uli]